jgi:hypothetical protein
MSVKNDLPIRAYNCLRWKFGEGFTADDVESALSEGRVTESDLFRTPNYGSKSHAAVKAWLQKEVPNGRWLTRYKKSRWVACNGDHFGRNKGPYPTEPGHYRVMISGDSEYLDGHCIYDFPDYETWVYISFEEDYMRFDAAHDEEVETMLAWFGPVDVPKCDCF